MNYVFQPFIVIRNLALMNCLIRVKLSLFNIEMFNVLNSENTQIVNEIFRIKNEASYELRQRLRFHMTLVNTVFSGTESIRFLVPKIRELILNDIKCLHNPRDL